MDWKKPQNDLKGYLGSLNRRDFFKGTGLATLFGLLGGNGCSSAGSKPIPTYESIGVRPVINCHGTVTVMGGSLVLPYVKRAIEEASRKYVFLDELQEKASIRLAELTGAEAGMVTSGAAGALLLAAAACVTGGDQKKMTQLPDSTGMKNEVISHTLHKHGFDRMFRVAGCSVQYFDSIAEMEAKMGDKTALVAALGSAFDKPESPREEEFVALAKKFGVPALVDAAAERPDVPDRYIKAGFDLVAYSGGKCMRGPQSTGLLIGRSDLIKAALTNNSPRPNIGRGMKVDKEEIIGCLAALEWWAKYRDHKGEWKTWENYIDHITKSISDIPSIRTEVLKPGRLNVTPTLSITWDAQQVGISPKEADDKLLNGDPRVKIPASGDGLVLNPYLLEEGEEKIVARRLREVLTKKA